MGNMTEMDLVALKGYASELESFKSRVNKHCNDLETGVGSCSNYMLDENSQKALQKGRQVAVDIKACLYPVEMILERIYQIIHDMESSHDFEIN